MGKILVFCLLHLCTLSSGIFLIQVWQHISWKMVCMWLSQRKGFYLAHNSMNSNHFTWTITDIFLYSYQLPYVAKDIQRQLMAVVFFVCCVVQCQTGYPRWDERSGQQMSQKVWAWYLVIFSCLSCGLWRIPACMLQKADLKATFHQQSIHVANDLQGRAHFTSGGQNLTTYLLDTALNVLYHVTISIVVFLMRIWCEPNAKWLNFFSGGAGRRIKTTSFVWKVNSNLNNNFFTSPTFSILITCVN